MEISRLSLIVKNLRQRLESLEKNQTELMDAMNDMRKERDVDEDNND